MKLAPPAYHSYPYGYYGYGPGYGRVWVPGYWERVWTGYGWQRVWHRGPLGVPLGGLEPEGGV